LAVDVDRRLTALERIGRTGSRLERAALERFVRTGVAYRRALHRAAHGQRMPGMVLPSAAQLQDWRALMHLYAETASGRVMPLPPDASAADHRGAHADLVAVRGRPA
jgi:hypothetical protein